MCRRPGGRAGLLARLVFDTLGLQRIELVPIRVNNRLVDYRAEPTPIPEAEDVLYQLAEREGTEVEVSSGIGTLWLR